MNGNFSNSFYFMRWLTSILLLFITLTCCNQSTAPLEPRSIDWKKEWEKNELNLKNLTRDILDQGSKKYVTGNNYFPGGFEYPFDDGFLIGRQFQRNGPENEIVDTKNITVTFYTDRGLLDHYSAFVFTNNSAAIRELDEKVERGGNDFTLEPG
jgi:hypothetical protein